MNQVKDNSVYILMIFIVIKVLISTITQVYHNRLNYLNVLKFRWLFSPMCKSVFDSQYNFVKFYNNYVLKILFNSCIYVFFFTNKVYCEQCSDNDLIFIIPFKMVTIIDNIICYNYISQMFVLLKFQYDKFSYKRPTACLFLVRCFL